jgi:endonuclease III
MDLLVNIGKERFNNTRDEIVHMVDDASANALLNDLTNYPHAYVLACLMDRQMKAERAWIIPYEIKKNLGTFKFNDLIMVSKTDFVKLFSDLKLHRFNDTMANIFYDALGLIKVKYNGNASLIWSNRPSSASVVYRFLEFNGSGIKISTMATNILARQFRIPLSDYYSVDISPDVHIIRVMKRTGLVPLDSDTSKIIYKARELNPEFPGIIDFSCWEIGRKWCRPNNPDCKSCILDKDCKKIIK